MFEKVTKYYSNKVVSKVTRNIYDFNISKAVVKDDEVKVLVEVDNVLLCLVNKDTEQRRVSLIEELDKDYHFAVQTYIKEWGKWLVINFTSDYFYVTMYKVPAYECPCGRYDKYSENLVIYYSRGEKYDDQCEWCGDK